jgi:hypothetical protein
MPSTVDLRTSASEPVLEDDSPAPALVYVVVGVGLLVCLTALLFAHGSFSLGTVALALLAALPFLLYARLALARPGAEAVVAGVLLLAVGSWGSVVAMGDGSGGDFVRLFVSLMLVELAVFGAGIVLRSLVPPAAR